jgi:two-component system OmpR family response regulator
MKTVLVVDDDPDIREMVCEALVTEGYQTVEASSGEQALSLFKQHQPNLVVLDILMPPGINGIDVCREIRKSDSAPIVFLSSKEDEVDRIRGLEEGAIRYVTKTEFSPRELVLEIDALFRLMDQSDSGDPDDDDQKVGFLQHGNLRVDPERLQTFWHEDSIRLGPIEYKIVTILLDKAGSVIEWNGLKKLVYGHDYKSESAIKSHIRNIRQKFSETDKGDPIEIVHGVGPRLVQKQK